MEATISSALGARRRLTAGGIGSCGFSASEEEISLGGGGGDCCPLIPAPTAKKRGGTATRCVRLSCLCVCACLILAIMCACK